ncbi:MAG: nucleoside monophosphate kinase [Patescibacteria group bacterium]
MHTAHPRPMNLVLLGPPGSGKGTQAQLLEERFSLYHLGTGDLIRAVYARAGKGETFADEVKARYDGGIPQPDHVILEMVEHELTRLHHKTGFVFDAFPLSTPQAIALEKMITTFDMREPIAISIDVVRAEAIRRLTLRKYCPNDKIVFHPQDADYKGNHCHICGSELQHRPDDTEELAGKRYDAYIQRILDLKAFYKERGQLLDVSGEQPIQAVFNDILHAIVPYL